MNFDLSLKTGKDSTMNYKSVSLERLTSCRHVMGTKLHLAIRPWARDAQAGDTLDIKATSRGVYWRVVAREEK